MTFLVAQRPGGPGGATALEAVHDRIRSCVACPLSRTRTQAVPASGVVTARIVAIGEAPGEKEDAAGVPFVGAAGRLLTELLEGAGIPRADLYITNTVKCRPPGNRDPQPGEVASCAHFLDAQLALVDPDVVLLLGRHALTRVLPEAGSISRCHGEAIRHRDRLYVPLYHPAAALYNGGMRGTLEADMRRVRGYLDEAALVAVAADAAAHLASTEPSSVAAAGVAPARVAPAGAPTESSPDPDVTQLPLFAPENGPA